MMLAVLLWREIFLDEGGGATAASRELFGDSGATAGLLRHWVCVLIAGLRLAHSVLRDDYDLDSIHSGKGAVLLDEVYAYTAAFASRDPPRRRGLRLAMRRYSRVTGRPLVGRPSQER